MKLKLKSIAPEELIEGRTYLCGRCCLSGDHIDWTTREFDGETLRICTDGVMLGDGPSFPIDEEYRMDDKYLIFELPLMPK